MSDVQPTIMMIVKGIKSSLPPEEVVTRARERMPQFRALTGLVQKYYAYDADADEWAGIYLWDSEEALTAFLESDLRRSIPAAYAVTEPPRIERFDLVDVLRRGAGEGSAVPE